MHSHPSAAPYATGAVAAAVTTTAGRISLQFASRSSMPPDLVELQILDIALPHQRGLVSKPFISGEVPDTLFDLPLRIRPSRRVVLFMLPHLTEHALCQAVPLRRQLAERTDHRYDLGKVTDKPNAFLGISGTIVQGHRRPCAPKLTRRCPGRVKKEGQPSRVSRRSS